MQQRSKLTSIISIFHYGLMGVGGGVLYFYINMDVWCVLLNIKVLCSPLWFLFQKNSCIFIFTEWAGWRNLTSVLLLAVIPASSVQNEHGHMKLCNKLMFRNLIPPLITGMDFNKMHDFSPSEKSHHKLSTTNVWRHTHTKKKNQMLIPFMNSFIFTFFVMWSMCRLYLEPFT